MNAGFVYRERIDRRGAGRLVLDYLADRYRHSTRARWAEILATGRVTLDGVTAHGDERLRRRQRLTYFREPWEEPTASLAFEVLATGPGWVAVDKPSGLPTLPGGGFLEHTLLHQLRRLHPTASPLHRLGRFTSGVVLCALDRATAARLSALFVERAVYKRYRTLASGSPTADRFEVDIAIGPVPYPPLGTLHAASALGRPALSTVSVLEQGTDSFLADVVIATGRPHQIRVHLAAAGHPLVGDPLYRAGGLPDPDGTAVPGDGGYSLHAAELRVDDIEVRAPVPQGLAQN
ncbi:MAG: 23S rRNA pseudouridine1911/1915/1917 synthase [Myxococcota bacterium]